jgi:hypothetical protein
VAACRRKEVATTPTVPRFHSCQRGRRKQGAVSIGSGDNT